MRWPGRGGATTAPTLAGGRDLRPLRGDCGVGRAGRTVVHGGRLVVVPWTVLFERAPRGRAAPHTGREITTRCGVRWRKIIAALFIRSRIARSTKGDGRGGDLVEAALRAGDPVVDLIRQPTHREVVGGSIGQEGDEGERADHDSAARSRRWRATWRGCCRSACRRRRRAGRGNESPCQAGRADGVGSLAHGGGNGAQRLLSADDDDRHDEQGHGERAGEHAALEFEHAHE